jgi:hypothetical protein
MSTQETAVDKTASPSPTEPPRSRFAVPESDLEAGRVTQAEMVQDVPNPHRLAPPEASNGAGDSGADGDGD